MRFVGSALCLALAAGGAQAAAGAVELAGRATIGPEARAVTLRLTCDAAGPGLSAALSVPRFADLTERFDFDALEGPTASQALLTGIQVAGSDGVRGVRISASGAVAADPPTGFTLTVAGARRSEDPLRAVAPALTKPGARLIWTQGSPRKGDAPLVATFAIGDAEADEAKAVLGPCFGR